MYVSKAVPRAAHVGAALNAQPRPADLVPVLSRLAERSPQPA
ncbi:hypothetical protein ACWDR9_26330 [Streptosporangium sandarakinum]